MKKTRKKKGFILNNKNNIKSYYVVTFLTVILLVIQGSIIAQIFTGVVKPDLTMITVVCFAFLWGEKKGLATGIITGLLQDIFLGPALGFFALTKMISAFIVILISREMYKEQVVAPMFIVFFVTIFHDSLTFLLTGFWDGKELSFFYLLERVFILRALYHFVLTLFIYPLIYRAEQSNLI